ncbi:MAG: acyl carrier protein [Proteobacteria bacterium]|nr:acyl carrier protein [Pseudomonadota bacterium]MCH8953131.1 acyl carrier protein [Pseudomonadota bacterium]
MTDDVGKRVARIIAEQAMLDPEAIKPDTTLDDLGLDSLALVEVVFGIEEAFDISVPFNANEPRASEFDISKVAHIITGVKQLIAAKG